MSASRIDRLQRLWRNIHLVIGAGLLVLLVPLAVSGALLVWKEPLDTLLHPERYAGTGEVGQPPSVYLGKALEAAGARAQAVAVRFPESPGKPVTVAIRSLGSDGGRVRPVTVYLDPPNARVLEVVDFRGSLIGVLHRFHENLTIPEYSGRAIVGWGGVAMLTSALTGLYLWWPRNAPWRRGLRWRRGANGWSNLHHAVGFWISLPLAVVALTGIYLGFPQQGRDALSAVAPMTPQRRGAQPLVPTRLTIDAALDAAVKSTPGAQPVAIFLPSQHDKAWRIALRGPAMDGDGSLMVDDASGSVSPAGRQLAGDRIAGWIRWIHEGSHAGLPWRIVVFLCGLAPPLLATTGVIIWLQRRRRSSARFAAGLRPAE